MLLLKALPLLEASSSGVVASRVIAAREDMASTGLDGIRVISAKVAIC